MRKCLMTLLSLALLIGCANASAETATPAISTPTPAATLTPVSTQQPTLTKTATPGVRFTQQCLLVDDKNIDIKNVSSGTLLLSFFDPDLPPAGRNFYILTDILADRQYKLITPDGNPLLSDLTISHNRNWLATMERIYDYQKMAYIKQSVWIFDSQGNARLKVDTDRTDLGTMRWLDNERLLIDTEEYGVLLLIKVFTGEQETITNDLPNSYPYDKSHLYLWWPVTYSPDLQWVTYMTGRTEYGNVYMQGPIVYDLAAKQIIWNKANGVGSRPAWSPDGEALAFTGGMDEYQLFIFDRSGSIKGVLDDSLPHRAFEFSWSPDGSYIAFWTEDSLMVYDREQDWLFDTCIPGNFQIGPEWSPDSKQFIANQTSTEPLLVDWEKQRVYKIKVIENSSIYGWMNSIP